MLIRTRKHLTQAEVVGLVERDVRASQTRGALPNWPMCAKCMAPVRAYFIEDKKSFVDVIAHCGHGSHFRQKQKKTIRKPRENIQDMPGNWLKDTIRHLVFFVS